MDKIITILGPTASGKTKLAIRLAKKFNGEIINADSRTIYKELDIGTDKPPKDKKQRRYLVNGVLHHLIDFLEPDKTFSIAEYQKFARQKIREIQERGKIPFLIGGSPLYVEAVIYNYKIPHVAPDLKLRKKLEKESLEKLVSRLDKLDPYALENVDLKNKRRVIRALEILIKSGSSIDKNISKKLPKNILVLGIKTDREKLYKKINKRVDMMIKNGLADEAKRLYKKYGKNTPALSGIGYRELVPYFKKEITLKEAEELIKRDSRRFAKRQLTWFKRDKNIKWVSNKKQAEREIKIFLKQ